ncbi:MAG: hypothetical protein Q4F95_05035 [Oscillospiraceae bacterium]|nr:hypothetical protein [Oscillospiraceae bacterium]
MKKIKKITVIILIVILLWLVMFIVDYLRVVSEKAPVFCVQTKDGCYTGAGYSYEMYPHIITGKKEYSLSFFGRIIKSNYTNQPSGVHR